MYILGINAYHGGASACLVRDGQLVAAAEEERFNRVKYWSGFPVKAIRYVLAEGGIGPEALDHIGISRNPSANLLKKALFALTKRPSVDLIRDRLSNFAKVSDLKGVFCDKMSLPLAGLKAQWHNVEHHRAHMASAFHVSPFEEAAVLSVDGMGDFVSTMWGVGRGSNIEVIGRITFPHSLGFMYTAVSQHLGFTKYGDEGKVMGLAPLGAPVYMDQMRDILRIQQDGTFELNLDYFALWNKGAAMTWNEDEPTLEALYSERMTEVLGPVRVPHSEITKHHENIARSLQEVLEEAEFALVRKLQRETGLTALCMAGGVALNSAFNGKILPETEFERIFIQPAAGDAGTAMGVCYHIQHEVLGFPREFVLKDAYTGPSFTDEETKAVLDRYGLKYETLDPDALVTRTAELIAGGNVVGWFQGRMEWGPRALGNRSILADPRREDMKDILNARIKHREKFRPFAPSILMERTDEFFDQCYPDPFMLKIYNVRAEKRSVIPAVTHVDGTGRLQTVDKESAPLYWKLIKAFESLTGVPVVLNTSFNENEPVVCRPEEAVECFLRTRMDALVLASHVVTQKA